MSRCDDRFFAAPTTRFSSTDTARGDGRVLGLTRAGVWVLFVLAAANGLFLYFAPGLADTDYAWSIKPRGERGVHRRRLPRRARSRPAWCSRATRWRSFSLLPPALWVLATTLLAATIIHEDRFKWDYAPTWVWAFVYALRAAGDPVPGRCASGASPSRCRPPTRGLRPLRVLSGDRSASALLVGAVALYAAPVDLGEDWLWPLTPLLGARRRRLVRAVRDDAADASRSACGGRSRALIGYATLGVLVRAAAVAAAAAPATTSAARARGSR